MGDTAEPEGSQVAGGLRCGLADQAGNTAWNASSASAVWPRMRAVGARKRKLVVACYRVWTH